MCRYCVLLAVLAFMLPGGAAAQHSSPYSQGNDIPPRLQWEANFGYCGEVSFISAGLYYGQYFSQYDARALASPGVPQHLRKSRLLIGVNDQTAAAAMHLNAAEWDTTNETSSTSFLAWVKQNVSAGYPVVIGYFNNEYLLYGNSNPSAGDPAYDHIGPVFGVASNHPLPSDTYYADDTLSLSDNGLSTQDHIPTMCSPTPSARFNRPASRPMRRTELSTRSGGAPQFRHRAYRSNGYGQRYAAGACGNKRQF